MDRRGLERHIAEQRVEARIFNRHGANDGRAATMNTIAAEQGKRDKQIRDSFDDLFRVTGRDSSSNETFEAMPRFAVLPKNDEHEVVTAEVSRTVVGGDGVVQVKFFERGRPQADETYESTVVIRHADSGESFAAWASGAHSPEGTVRLLQETEAMQQHAEDTLDLLWGALSDPELNPHFAHRANDMLAAAEAARQSQESAQSVQGA